MHFNDVLLEAAARPGHRGAAGSRRAASNHGVISPSRRGKKALRRFTSGEISVLVATDVAARGIDIDDIGAVIHYEPAADGKAYLHRSGRTARAWQGWLAATLAKYNQARAVHGCSAPAPAVHEADRRSSTTPSCEPE